MNKKIIILGGDGFCGWPTSLHLSNLGYDVTIVDNLVRRKIDVELECDSLTPISSMSNRIKRWKELTGKTIRFEYFDVAKHYHRLLSLILEIQPKAVVHFAEQRAAPYSMKSSWHKRYTVNNNLNATNNLLAAIVESELDIHVVHLGTTGVYGYGTINQVIPEGYLPIYLKNENGEYVQKEILYPASPGSVYHMTKTQDALCFFYYNKNDNLRITDLHQGIVWGTDTKETKLDEVLINRFDYDGDYGTVLNRFLMQSAIGHPITVHGTGGQTRAFIHIQNTVQCIQIAIENPPQKYEKVAVFNQTTETHRIINLARLITKITGAEIRTYKNPRKEDTENELRLTNKKFLELGLNPIKLEIGLLEEIKNIANKYSHRCYKDRIICRSVWKSDMLVDEEGEKFI
jgi:UDP-sulfoquinovose synthase